MPGSPTTPGWPSARVGALGHIAFHYTDSVGTRKHFSIAAQWLACTFPYRRFADVLADACARLGADVGRYSFIAVDLHLLLLAGLPAHPCEKTIVANHWDIYCHCAGRRHCEDFGCAILKAIGLLVFVRVETFHTASVDSRHLALAHRATAVGGQQSFASTHRGGGVAPLAASLVGLIEPPRSIPG
jgi:hypothetical protein